MKQAACIYIENAGTGQVLLTTRRDSTTVGLPGGKVDPGETPSQAAIRELFEETGLSLKEQDLTLVYQGVCEGEVDYDTFCYVASVDPVVIPGGQEEGIESYWGSVEMLITNSPFANYNKIILETIAKQRAEMLAE